MPTRKRAADPEALARDLRRRLGRTRSKLTRALDKLADAPADERRAEVRTSRGGRTITIVNRGGVTIGRPKKKSD